MQNNILLGLVDKRINHFKNSSVLWFDDLHACFEFPVEIGCRIMDKLAFLVYSLGFGVHRDLFIWIILAMME